MSHDLPAASAPADRQGIINNVSAYVLRIGVITSALTMLVGIAFSFAHRRVSVERMQTARFEYNPAAIVHGIKSGSGQAIIEMGIYLLVLTPVARVAMSMILFTFVERDWAYALITLVVLILTLLGLLWLG